MSNSRRTYSAGSSSHTSAPARGTRLAASSDLTTPTDSRYRWRVAPADSSSAAMDSAWGSLAASALVDTEASTTTLEVTFTSPGWYAVLLDEYPTSGKRSARHRSYQSAVVCRYVRREIRALFPEDQASVDPKSVNPKSTE